MQLLFASRKQGVQYYLSVFQSDRLVKIPYKK
jgi:hypothetical protein